MSDHRCSSDLAAHDWAAAHVACQAEFARAGDVSRAGDAAKAALYLMRPEDAIRLATIALAGPTVADAHSTLGSAHLLRDDFGPARAHLEIAARLHAAAGNAAAEARDQHQLSGVAYGRGDYQAALDAEASARRAALRAHDEHMVVFLDIARSDILRRIGDLRQAEAEIERALTEAKLAEDRVVALLKRGEVHLDLGHPALAREPLTRALDEERRAKLPRSQLLVGLHLNMAYVERKAHAFPRALDEMEQARQLGTDTMTYRLNRGLVYAEMGRLGDAIADLIAAEAEHPEGEWSWWVPFQHAQAAARLGDVATAIAEDRRSMQQVAELASHAGSFGPTVVAAHREPHLHLIGLLAAHQQWNDVLDVVATMDSQLLLDSRESPSERAPSSAGAAPAPARRHAAAPPVTPDAVRRAIDAWRGRRLVIVVPGGDRVWQIDVRDGAIAGRDVGDAAAMAALARQLEAEPDNADVGRRLGDALLPPPPWQRGERIELLVVGPIARAPLAGLRAGDSPAIASHALARAAGLLPRHAAAHGSAAPVVIGDPNRDLPAAADDARWLMGPLGATVLIGDSATRAAFRAAAGTRLLHVAAHTTQRLGDSAIELADGPLGVDGVAVLVPAPSLVVLATCGASSGRDDAGNGSLVNAFLDAGADIVIGTRWSIDDAQASRLTRAFYLARRALDPVAALAAAQLGSGTPSRTAAAFEAFVARPLQD